ncbi:MAG: hypothetical protein BWK80_07725 [Desulfobacteraceae bacterium IS3]|nr:MAG: hypothetical protein BWK80_07725 [Desulfobacteraceae bacterium IS3]
MRLSSPVDKTICKIVLRLSASRFFPKNRTFCIKIHKPVCISYREICKANIIFFRYYSLKDSCSLLMQRSNKSWIILSSA